MRTWIAAAIVITGLAFDGPVAILAPAEAAQTASSPKAADLSPRRYIRRYRPYEPTYYARPTYYRPYPYALQVPFFLGFGFGPWW